MSRLRQSCMSFPKGRGRVDPRFAHVFALELNLPPSRCLAVLSGGAGLRAWVVRTEGADSVPFAAVFAFGCHPTLAARQGTRPDGDWPSRAARRIEAAGRVAIFTPGRARRCDGDSAARKRRRPGAHGRHSRRGRCRVDRHSATPAMDDGSRPNRQIRALPPGQARVSSGPGALPSLTPSACSRVRPSSPGSARWNLPPRSS
jgi:hypothetical protein